MRRSFFNEQISTGTTGRGETDEKLRLEFQVTRPFGAHIWQQWGHRIFWNFLKKNCWALEKRMLSVCKIICQVGGEI
jgi:hypothetical protein